MDVDEPTLSHGEIEAIARRLDRPVVLVGMMGVGKSSVGRKLANQLHLPFVDADEEIEAAAQMSVAEIFEQFGEAYFRDGERRVIGRLLDGERKVIATGGGAFATEATRATILEKGIAVWLDCDIDTLIERVGRRDHRPLLRSGDPREILTRLQAERTPAYAQAPFRVNSRSGPHSRTVGAILKELERWQ